MAASWISSAQKGQGFIGPLRYAEASPAAMRVAPYDGSDGLANSLEVAATLLLLGAQVIAEYERIETGEATGADIP